MKKIGIMAVLFAALCMMSGCLKDVPLTDREMDIVAEYAARALLGTIPPNTMSDYEPLPPKEEVLPTPTPTPTLTPVPEVTGEPHPTDEAPKPTATPVPENSEATGEQLTRVVGAEGFVFSYTEGDYQLVSSIEEGDYFSLDPKPGRQYLIVSFTATNTTDESIALNTMEKKLKCEVDVNLGKVSRASLSMLKNDLQYMSGSEIVPAGESFQTVLVFEISALEEIKTAHVRITNQEEEVVIIKLK